MGYRIRITRGLSIGSSGIRLSTRIGKARLSIGRSGPRAAIGRFLFWCYQR